MGQLLDKLDVAIKRAEELTASISEANDAAGATPGGGGGGASPFLSGAPTASPARTTVVINIPPSKSGGSGGGGGGGSRSAPTLIETLRIGNKSLLVQEEILAELARIRAAQSELFGGAIFRMKSGSR